jgi:hypothetical protein
MPSGMHGHVSAFLGDIFICGDRISLFKPLVARLACQKNDKKTEPPGRSANADHFGPPCAGQAACQAQTRVQDRAFSRGIEQNGEGLDNSKLGNRQ